jgi:hypothetical protein
VYEKSSRSLLHPRTGVESEKKSEIYVSFARLRMIPIDIRVVIYIRRCASQCSVRSMTENATQRSPLAGSGVCSKNVTDRQTDRQLGVAGLSASNDLWNVPGNVKPEALQASKPPLSAGPLRTGQQKISLKFGTLIAQQHILSSRIHEAPGLMVRPET